MYSVCHTYMNVSLPKSSIKAHLLPNLKNPLLSVGQFYDADCVTIFDKHKMSLYHLTPDIHCQLKTIENSIFIAKHDSKNGLYWKTPSNSTAHQYNNLY